MFMEDNQWKCWWCGMSHANCGHHNFGRGREEGCEKSVLNYVPLNNHECHLPIHGKISTDKGKKKFFQQTLDHLEGIGYVLKPIDNEFLAKYSLELKRLGFIL